MNACRTCSDTSDVVPLCPAQNLFLKPVARLNVSVQLPQLKAPDKSISSWEVMERLRKMVKPDKFSSLRVTKSTLEFIRFEGEVETKSKLPGLVAKLDMKSIKLSGFSDALKVRAAEAKIQFPTRHVWDIYFREAKHMNEMKPGERPDTMHITNLPCKWFTLPEYQDKDAKPSEYIFRKVFETFGEVRYVDVPCTDPYRSRMRSKTTDADADGIKTFSFDEGHSFEGFVQYKEYMSFLKAMTALRGMQLLYKEKEKAWTATIKVDFDRSKHMTDHAIRRRHVDRERLIQQDALLLDKERRMREIVEARKDEMRKKEEAKHLAEVEAEEEKKKGKKKQKLLQVEDAEKERRRVKKRLAREERKLREAQQKLENIHLLDMLLEKVKVKQMLKKQAKKDKKKKKKLKPETAPKQTEKEEEEDRELLLNRELELRQRLLFKYKEALDKQLAEEDAKEETSNGQPADEEAGPSGETAAPSTPAKPNLSAETICETAETTCDATETTCVAAETVAPTLETTDATEECNGPSNGATNEINSEELPEEPKEITSEIHAEDDSPAKSLPQVSREATPSSEELSSPALNMQASDESLDSSESEMTPSEMSESEEESESSKSEKEPPKKKEKKAKKDKKKKHKSKKDKKKKSSKKEKKSKSSKSSVKEEKIKKEVKEEDVDEAGPSSHRIASQVVWRGGGGGHWRGRFPRHFRGGGRGGRPPPWFEGGQEFFDFGFFPPPWHFHGGGPFFHQRGYRRPNMRRPYFRHPAQPAPGYYDNMNEAYEKYFLKFARKNPDDRDDYSDHRSRSSSRDHRRSRSRSWSRSRSRDSRRRSSSRSRSRSRRRHRSRSRSRRSRSRSRSRGHSSDKSLSRSRSRSRGRDRSRSRSRGRRSRSRESRSRSRGKTSNHSRGRERSRSREKNRSRSRSRSKQRSKSRSRSRNKSKSK